MHRVTTPVAAVLLTLALSAGLCRWPPADPPSRARLVSGLHSAPTPGPAPAPAARHTVGEADPCSRSVSRYLNATEYVRELCRSANASGQDEVCLRAHQRQRSRAWAKAHACDLLGENLCDRVQRLQRSGRPLPPTYAAALRANEAVARRPFWDPNACDVRRWLGRCPVASGLPRLLVVARGQQRRPVEW
eukprot:EG_transcript_34310